MNLPRASGVLLHPTCLPGPYGIGSFNEWAALWVDFLAGAGQTVWQVLPLGPTTLGDSPYQSFSSHAGNPNLIGLEPLVEEDLLDEAWLEDAPEFPEDRVDYGAIYDWKRPLLRKLADHFPDRARPEQLAGFQQFCKSQQAWLDDYALFMSLKEAHDNKPWQDWPRPLRTRNARALQNALREQAAAVRNHKLNQWFFYRQWLELKSYANSKGIRILGDIPIFVALDSADTWANPELFHLGADSKPTVVAGVPPDYFSSTGQLWGNPLYRWPRHHKDGYAWWIRRIQTALKLCDLIRIDHFRGFSGYWEIPASAKTAEPGKWVKGPGQLFFRKIQEKLGKLPIVAEDLGEITPDVYELRDRFGLPGMLVLQFAFSDPGNKFLPHHHRENFVVYTGTHDNDTTVGWFRKSSNPHERKYFLRYVGLEAETDDKAVSRAMIRAAMGSVARLCIVPLQDLLALGTEARMNMPSSQMGNWQWRFRPEQLTPAIQADLEKLTYLYGRTRQTPGAER